MKLAQKYFQYKTGSAIQIENNEEEDGESD
jgi:hypothetical protein